MRGYHKIIVNVKCNNSIWLCKKTFSFHFFFLNRCILNCVWKWKWNSLSHIQLLQPHGLYSLLNSLGQNTGVGKPVPSPGDLPNPGIELRTPTLQADSSPAEPLGKPLVCGIVCGWNEMRWCLGKREQEGRKGGRGKPYILGRNKQKSKGDRWNKCDKILIIVGF